jgi:hypothetical protein
MGMLYIHSPKNPGPFPKLPKKKINKKIFNSLALSKYQSVVGERPLVAGWPRVNTWTKLDCHIFKYFLKFSCLPLSTQVVNSCWLAPAHARTAQTFLQNFKHP